MESNSYWSLSSDYMGLIMKKAAILAAGDSTRMLPLSAYYPKHLLPAGGRPLIFHTLLGLQKAGISEVLIVYGYHANKLKEAIDSKDWGKMSISYTFQKERRGTAHAAGYARDFAGGDPILLVYGDVMTDGGAISDLIVFHNKGSFDLTMSVYPVSSPSNFGIVKVENDMAIDLIEKPSPDLNVGNLANAGIYCVTDELWDAIDRTVVSKRGELEITDSIMMLIKRGRVGAFTIPTWWVDVGRPWDLLEVNRLILENQQRRIEGEVEEGAVIKGNVVVEAGAIIRSGAYIQGPVYIGEGSVVGPNCYIRPHTYLVRGVKVGNAVEVKNSIVMEESSIGHLSYVGDSIIGKKVNFGAGTITANLRHDNRSILVTVKGRRENTGRRKMGAVIGDNVKTGIGTLLSPGVVVYNDSRTGVGVIVDRDIPPHRLVLSVQQKRTVDLGVD